MRGGAAVLYDKLSEYSKKGMAPFHMPGHKRNTALLGHELPYQLDITELPGFDNLQAPSGVLRDTAALAEKLYGARRAFPLVGGSTVGLLAAIHSIVRRGDKVIMARNCHKSVYNAVELFELRPVYLVPETDDMTGIAGSVWPGQVRAAMQRHPEAKLVIITSPTYEGVVSDIAAICDAAHRQGIPVLVDAAHGAHLGFSDDFPPDAVRCGADLTVTSLHKTLPALTQCALTLTARELVDDHRLQASVNLFQTSSPSYVLLASVDRCLRLLEEDGSRLFKGYVKNLKAFDEAVTDLKKLRVLCRGTDNLSLHSGFYGFDPGKIIIDTGSTNLTGIALMRLLRERYGIELEMAGAGYAVAMTSIADKREAFARLSDALSEIDRMDELVSRERMKGIAFTLPKRLKTVTEAVNIKGSFKALDKAVGLISLEYVWAYPPGIPFLVPGEMIGDDAVQLITRLSTEGIAVSSSGGRLPDMLRCADV
jgi:arginine/lysine/ornithine decarboxylase